MSISTVHSTTAALLTSRAQSTVHSTTASFIDTDTSSVWTLTPSVGIQLVLNISVTQQLDFSQDADAQNIKAASSVWTLTPSVGITTILNRDITQQFDFSQVADHNVLFLSASNALAFGQDVVTGPNTFNPSVSQQLDFFQAADSNVRFLSALNALVFGQVTSFFLALNISIIQQLDFFQLADSHIRELSASNALAFSQEAVTGPNIFNLALSQPWIIEADGRKTIILSVTSALAFGQSGNRAGVGENQLDFDHLVSFIQSKQTSNQWLFSQLATAVYGIRNLFASNEWLCNGFGSIQVISTVISTVCNPDAEPSGIRINDPNFNSPDNQVSVPLPSQLVLRETIEFFNGVVPTLVIRASEFGNSEVHSKGNLFKRLRGGAPVSNHLVSKPKLRTLLFSVTALKPADRDAIQAFIAGTLGTQIRFTDASSQVFVGVISNPDSIIAEIADIQHEANFELTLADSDTYSGP